jgi:hypothetical protein
MQRFKITLGPLLVARACTTKAYMGHVGPFSSFVVSVFERGLDQIDIEMAEEGPIEPNESE